MKNKAVLCFALIPILIVAYEFYNYERSSRVLLMGSIPSGMSPQDAKIRLGVSEWRDASGSTGRDGISDFMASVEPYTYMGFQGKLTVEFYDNQLYKAFFFPLKNPQSCQSKIAKSFSLQGGEWSDGFLKIDQSQNFEGNVQTRWMNMYIFHEYVAWISRNG